MIAGILAGLLAAFFQSLSYLATRHFVQRRVEGGGGGSRSLLILAHVWMGLASLAALPLLWPASGMPPLASYAQPLVLTAGFYLSGQVGLMLALRYAEPSRISPMLAFKIVILAGMASVFPAAAGAAPSGPTPLQWVAIVLCVGGAVILNYSGGKTHPRAAAGVIIACVSYSLSDWNIKLLVDALAAGFPGDAADPWRYVRLSSLATFLTYALCGVVAVAALPAAGNLRRGRDWLGATPFAAAWLTAMLFLFACFGLVGVVLGNILQSTRGLMSVVMASLLITWGHHHIEQRQGRGVLVRRLVAAGLMTAAVTLYVLERARVM